jgi:hypothetical protein
MPADRAMTLVVAEKATQAFSAREALQVERDLLRLCVEVVNAEHGGAASSVDDRENAATTGWQDPPRTRTDLRTFLSNADHLSHPSQQRRGAAKLLLDVDGVEAIRASSTTAGTSCSLVEKPPLRSSVHCIGVRIALRSFSRRFSPIPISSPYRSTGGPGQREDQAVGEFQASLVSQHRRQPPAYPAAVDVHRGFGGELGEDSLSVSVRQTPRSSSSWFRRKSAH